MRTLAILVVSTLCIPTVAATSGRAAPSPTSPAAAAYSGAVTNICAGALLFDGAHHEGTRADAVAIARAIRASTRRRLARVTAVPVPAELESLNSRWISSQRKLSDLYAKLWVRIYDTIDAAHTPAQRATLAARLDKLVAQPDALRAKAGRLELALRIPDCTGGGADTQRVGR